jgi:hypothetical protein
MGKIVEAATLGIVKDPFGTEAAAEAAMRGTTQAAEAQLAATEKNIEFQKWLWGEQKELAAPYAAAGAGALPQLQEMTAGGFDVAQDPFYQALLAERTKGVEQSAAARGMQLSGRALQEIGRGTTTEMMGAYGRRQQQIQNLFNLASMGQAAAAGQAQAGGQMGGRVGQSILAGGAAQAGMYQDIGQIQAAQAQAPFQQLMSIGQLGAMAYGGGALGAGAGMASAASTPSATPSGAYGPMASGYQF